MSNLSGPSVVRIVLPICLLWAFNHPAGAGTGHWRTFDISDGVVAGEVFSLFQDLDGMIWVGAGNGASRYDGYAWETFGRETGSPIVQDRDGSLWFFTGRGFLNRYQPSRSGSPWKAYEYPQALLEAARRSPLRLNEQAKVFQDLDGRLWIGTVAGVFRFDPREADKSDPQSSAWRTLTTGNGLASDTVHVVVQSRSGAMWFGTSAGVSRYRPGQTPAWTTFTEQHGLAGNNVTSLFEDSEGRLWFGSVNGKVSRYDPSAEEESVWAVFSDIDGLQGGGVQSIDQDLEGNLWIRSGQRFGVGGGGVIRFDGKKWTVFTAEQGLADNNVSSVLLGANGHIWFATYGGASRFDGRAWESFTAEDGLADNNVLVILEDRDGFLWFGTQGGGISRYSGDTWQSLTVSDGLSHSSIHSLYQDRAGDLWVGTQEGLSKRTAQGSAFQQEVPLSKNRVHTILRDDQDHLWVGTYRGGLKQYDGNAWTTYDTNSGWSSNTVWCSLHDRDGSLWFGTRRGASHFDPSNGAWTHYTPEDGLGAERVWSIAQDPKGHIWFGTLGGGASQFDGTSWKTLTTQDGLASDIVWSVAPDNRGGIWFGTLRGLSRYDGKSLVTYTADDGLAHEDVRSLRADRHGHLWFGTAGGGVGRFDGKVFQSLTRSDGLVNHHVRSIFEDRDGNFWFGTSGGLSRYRPPPVATVPVFIDAVVTDRRHSGVSRLSTPSTTGIIAFEFHAISLRTRPGALVYRYRLKGREEEWKNTRQRRVEYQDLPTGEYVFELLAVDRDLAYSDTARVEIEVFFEPISSSVRITDVQIQDVFASFYKTYADRPVGSALIANISPNEVEATLGFYIPALMRRPFEQTIVLAPTSKQHVPLPVVFDPAILDLQGTVPAAAEVSLTCEIGDQTISVKQAKNIKVHGRGALIWDQIGRAAAFVTPEDASVATFSRGLYDAYRHQLKGNRVDGNIPIAMLLFEALNAHGIRYAKDAATPYAKVKGNITAVDHIQYPSELLDNRLGDCDDCTVLYCSLLENLNIPTAFIDAPEHILMMFDSGVTDRHALGFSLDPERFIDRGGHFWIPIEVTKLGEGSFMQAWELGARNVQRLAEEDMLTITDVRDVWNDFPNAHPGSSGKMDLPNPVQFENGFNEDLSRLSELREQYIDRTYIRPLMADPSDHDRRLDLGRTRIESERYAEAIGWLMPLLQTDHRAEAYYLIGYAYAGKKDYGAAAQYIEMAVVADPSNEGYSRSLEVVNRLKP